LAYRSDVADSDAIELARFDQNRDTSWDAGCQAHVLLAHPSSEPEGAERRADALIVHARRIDKRAHLPLTPM
jgi:hypothetical protein